REVDVFTQSIAGLAEAVGELAEFAFAGLERRPREPDHRRQLGRDPDALVAQQEAGAIERIVGEAVLGNEREVEQCAERRRPAGAGPLRAKIDQRWVRAVALADRRAPVA